MVFDAQDKAPDLSILPSGIEGKPIILIKNKVDLTGESTGITHNDEQTQLSLSAKQSKGIDLLRQELSSIAGLSDTGEGVLLARKRHIIALESALDSTRYALDQLNNNASELVAEDLRQAAQYLR